MKRFNLIFAAMVQLLFAQKTATTKEVKEKIRLENPNLDIRQKEVSAEMENIMLQNMIPNLDVEDVNTNGNDHRLYKLTNGATVAAPAAQTVATPAVQTPAVNQKEYTVKFSGVKITGTAAEIEAYADEQNIPIRYSDSKDEFYNLMEVNVEYLKNIYAKEITDLATNHFNVKSNRADVKMALNSQVLQAVVARYDEIQATMVG